MGSKDVTLPPPALSLSLCICYTVQCPFIKLFTFPIGSQSVLCCNCKIVYLTYQLFIDIVLYYTILLVHLDQIYVILKCYRQCKTYKKNNNSFFTKQAVFWMQCIYIKQQMTMFQTKHEHNGKCSCYDIHGAYLL